MKTFSINNKVECKEKLHLTRAEIDKLYKTFDKLIIYSQGLDVPMTEILTKILSRKIKLNYYDYANINRYMWAIYKKVPHQTKAMSLYTEDNDTEYIEDMWGYGKDLYTKDNDLKDFSITLLDNISDGNSRIIGKNYYKIGLTLKLRLLEGIELKAMVIEIKKKLLGLPYNYKHFERYAPVIKKNKELQNFLIECIKEDSELEHLNLFQTASENSAKVKQEVKEQKRKKQVVFT